MKRLLFVCLLMLLATSAFAAKREQPRGKAVLTPDPVVQVPDAKTDAPAAEAAKKAPGPRDVTANQEIGNGCIEYVVLGIWHFWVGDTCTTGGGGGGGW